MVITRLFSLLFSLLSAAYVWSQKPYVEIFVEPDNVEVGEHFNVVVKSNISGEIEIKFPKEFEQGYNVMNRMEQDYDGNSGEIITYFFHGRSGLLNAEGKFTFGPALIKKGNKVYRSNKVTVYATIEPHPNDSKISANILNKPACGAIELSKEKVYVGEALVVKSKVFSQFKPTHYDSYRSYIFEPAADQHKLKETDEPLVEYGVFKGKRRFSFEHDQQVVFLNNPGRIKVEPFVMTLQSGFDGFEVRSRRNHIKVLPLPAGAPASFSGGVGHFLIKGEMDKSSIKQGDVLNYTLVISGNGNLHDINKPKINFGEFFELYGDPEIHENFKFTTKGAEGEIRYVYHLRAVKSGTAKIGQTHLSYFDPSAEIYKTVKTSSFQTEIQENPDFIVKDQSVSSTSEAKIERFNTQPETETSEGVFSHKAVKWISISAPFCLAFLFLLFRKKKKDEKRPSTSASETNDMPFQKVSSQEFLSVLQSHVNNGNELPFFTQLAKDLQVAVSQAAKNDPTWVLSKAEKQSFFGSKNLSPEFQSAFFTLEQTCELCRYACQKPESDLELYLDKAKYIFETLEA